MVYISDTNKSCCYILLLFPRPRFLRELRYFFSAVSLIDNSLFFFDKNCTQKRDVANHCIDVI